MLRIDRETYDVVPIGITTGGRWVLAADDPSRWELGEGVLPEVKDGDGPGVLVPLDFGMVGTLDEEMKQALVNMLLAFVNKDPSKLMRVFFSLELLDETARRSELSYDLSRLINYYHHIPVAHLSIARIFQDLNTIIRRYRIALPVDPAAAPDFPRLPRLSESGPDLQAERCGSVG